MNNTEISIKNYILAGKSTFTIQSRNSNVRFTYKVVKSEDGKVYFVNLLTGPNNESDFTYLGVIKENNVGLNFYLTAKSKQNKDSKCVIAFDFLIKNINDNFIHPNLIFLKSSNCCRCGSKLTTPDSIMDGIGPECKKLIAKNK